MGEPKSTAEMSARRRQVVNGVIAIVVLPSLFCIATDREYWPYSPYPMYSGLPGNTRDEVAVFAVPARPGGDEFELREEEQILPFDRQRLWQASRRILRFAEREGDTERLDAALTDLHTRYERRRRAGEHDGPPIRSVRIYRQFWDDIDPRVNPLPPPDRRYLVGESRAELRGPS